METRIKLSTASLDQVHDLDAGDTTTNVMSFSPDGKYIAGGAYYAVWVWRVEDGFMAYTYDAKKRHEHNCGYNHSNICHMHEGPYPSWKLNNGDIEMGGMDDSRHPQELDVVRYGSEPDVDVTEISWSTDSTMLAVSMAGVGVSSKLCSIHLFAKG